MESFDPYVVEAELGRGGMGVVYRAHHRELDRKVALKVPTFANDGHRRRFLREADALGRLTHPNILKVHSTGLTRVHDSAEAGRVFLVLELIEGESLDARLERRDLPSCREATVLVAKLARALEYAHGLGLLHRDVKPANVLLTTDGEPKLSDFGLTKDLGVVDRSLLTQHGQMLGSPGYAAPEQLAVVSGEQSPTTDVYGLGATLYAALTGSAPFTGSLMEIVTSTLEHAPAPPSELRPDVPAGLEAVCLRCLEKDPARRYPSAAALADDLERVARDEAPRQARRSGRPLLGHVTRLARRSVVLSGAVLAVALTSVGVAVLEGQRVSLTREATEGLVLQGDEARAAGDAARALDVYTRALDLDPTSALALERRGALRLSQGDVDGAHADLSACLARAPRATALGLRGQARARRGDPAGAAADLARALALDPYDVEVLLLRGTGRLATDPAGAALDFDGVLASDGTRLAAWSGRASIRLSTGDVAGAIEDLSTALVLAPGDPELLQRRALAHERAGALVAADADVTEALARVASARTAPLLLLRARLRLARGDSAAAIEDLTASLERGQDASTYLLRARAWGTDQSARAEADFSRALELDPTLAEAWLARGRARAARRDPEGASHDLARAGALDPRLLAAHVELAQLRYKARDWEGVVAAATSALAVDAGNSEMLRRRGRAHKALGELTQAAADVQRSVELDPRDGETWFELAEYQFAAGQLETAIDSATRSLQLQPDRAKTYRLRGLARTKKHDRGGLDDLTHATELDKKTFSYLALASGFEALRDLAGAEGALTSALALESDPGSRLVIHQRRGSLRLTLGDLVGALEESDRVALLGFGSADMSAWRATSLEEWDRAVERAPARAEAWAGRALARSRVQHNDGAEKDAQRALELDPAGPWPLVARGAVLLNQGAGPRAAVDLERAVALAPQHSTWWLLLARARLRSGLRPEGLQALVRAIELEPANGAAWAALGAHKLGDGDLAGAVASCTRAIELSPFFQGAWESRAHARLKLGDAAGAVTDASRGIELSPAHGPTWAIRGRARALLREPDAAADLARALELLPRDHWLIPGCKRALEQLGASSGR